MHESRQFPPVVSGLTCIYGRKTPASPPINEHSEGMRKISEDALIDDVTRRLSDGHPEISPAEISVVVANARARFVNSAVRDFVPVLVQRRAERSLADREREARIAS